MGLWFTLVERGFEGYKGVSLFKRRTKPKVQGSHTGSSARSSSLCGVLHEGPAAQLRGVAPCGERLKIARLPNYTRRIGLANGMHYRIIIIN